MHDQLIRLRTAARRVGLLLLPLVVSSSLWATPQPAATQEATVTIEQVEPGNVFVEGQTPVFDVATSAAEVRWSVQNLGNPDDPPIDGGPAAPGRVSVPIESVGYYELQVRAGGEPATAIFAVMPPTDPSADNPFTFGVQTHFGNAGGAWDDWENLVPMLDPIGVETIRDAQAWDVLGEPRQAEPNWEEPPASTRYAGYMAALDRADIEPLNNFGRRNRHYGNVTPDDGPRREAFAHFAADVVTHYRDESGQRQINQVGVYNEPNFWTFGDAGPDDDNDGHGDGSADALPVPHAQLAAATYEAVHEVAPDVTVAAPELAAGSWLQDTCDPPPPGGQVPCNPTVPGWEEWLRQYFEAGGLDYLDAVSVHPYRQRQGRGPEGLEDQIDTVRRLIREEDTADEEDLAKPIWITEQGWRTNERTGNCGNLRPTCEDTQAAFVPRTYVLAMAEGQLPGGGVANPVERFYWFNFLDGPREDDSEQDPGDGDDQPNEPPDTRFGLVEELDARQPDGTQEYRVKPSYMTYGVMTSQLGIRPYQGEDQHPEGVYSYQFGQGQDQVHVMWVPEGETDVDVLTDEPVDVVYDMGGTETYEPTNGRVSLTLSGHVQYVHGPIGGVESPA